MSSVSVAYWAEGPTDRAAARRLIAAVGAEPGPDYAQRRGAVSGKDYLDRRLSAFNAAARIYPWFVLRDSDGECPVDIAARLLPEPAPNMCFRIAVPTLESWLMADHAAFAQFFALRQSLVPDAPEVSRDPLGTMISLLRTAGRREVRQLTIPSQSSRRRVGVEYATYLIEFINDHWEPHRAAANAPSLERALRRLGHIVANST